MKFKIGDKVVLTGELYYSSNDLKPKSYIENKHTWHHKKISHSSIHHSIKKITYRTSHK